MYNLITIYILQAQWSMFMFIIRFVPEGVLIIM